MSYFIVLAIYILDQLSKLCASRFLVQGASVPLVENIFHLTLVHNTGAAFGMLKTGLCLFVAIAVVSTAVIVYFLWKKSNLLKGSESLALCMILGGTLGNLTDRLRLGYVIDFIDFRVWPVFNLADSCITVGAVILGWSILFSRRKERGE